jgi:hypothetical protein
MFEGYRQHDCQECLRYLISHLNETQLKILVPTPAALENVKRPMRVIRNPGPAVSLPTGPGNRESPSETDDLDDDARSDTSNEVRALRLGGRPTPAFQLAHRPETRTSPFSCSSPDDRSTRALRSNSAQLTPNDDQPFAASSPELLAGSSLPAADTQGEMSSPTGSEHLDDDLSDAASGPVAAPRSQQTLRPAPTELPVSKPCTEPARAESPANPKTDIKLPTLTYVDAMFQGQLVYTTRCLCCEAETTRSEGFHDLSLPVPERPASLPACLDDAYKGVEVLDGNNKFFCERCHAHNEATRSVRLGHLPPVLTIHLNRSSNFGLGKVRPAFSGLAPPLILCCLVDIHPHSDPYNAGHGYLDSRLHCSQHPLPPQRRDLSLWSKRHFWPLLCFYPTDALRQRTANCSRRRQTSD